MLFIVGKVDGFDAWRIVTDDGRQKVVSTSEIEKHMRTGNLKIENAVLGKIDKKMRGYFCDLEKLTSNSGYVTYIKDDIFIKSDGEIVSGRQVMSQRIPINNGRYFMEKNSNILLNEVFRLLNEFPNGDPRSSRDSPRDLIDREIRNTVLKVKFKELVVGKKYFLADGFGGLYNDMGCAYDYYTGCSGYVEILEDFKKGEKYGYLAKITAGTFRVLADNSFGNGSPITSTGYQTGKVGRIYGDLCVAELYDV